MILILRYPLHSYFKVVTNKTRFVFIWRSLKRLLDVDCFGGIMGHSRRLEVARMINLLR